MPGWGKLVVGALIGVAGTVYATNEELRKKLPGAARDLPDTVRRRVESAISAGRAASSERRREILRDLEKHGGQHPVRDGQPDPEGGSEGTGEAGSEGGQPEAEESPDAGTKDAGQSPEPGDQEKRT